MIDKIAVLIPCYNESKSIAKVVKDAKEALPEATIYVYDNKGYNEWTADFACEQCGKFGVSVNEDFLPVGRCCYCGWDNELEKCRRCNQLVAADTLEDGLCPSCSG